MATIHPKPQKIMNQKYVIYRILIVWDNGMRKSFDKKYYTNDLRTARNQYKKMYNAQRVFLSYHEIGE